MRQVSVTTQYESLTVAEVIRKIRDRELRYVAYLEGDRIYFPFRVVYWAVHPRWTNGGDVVQYVDSVDYYNFEPVGGWK